MFWLGRIGKWRHPFNSPLLIGRFAIKVFLYAVFFLLFLAAWCSRPACRGLTNDFTENHSDLGLDNFGSTSLMCEVRTHGLQWYRKEKMRILLFREQTSLC